MKERGIIFPAPMVRAILEGRKTQTRRICKITHRTPGLACLLTEGMPERPKAAAQLCPYGRPGERLWVRETWQHANYPLGPYQPGATVFYRADYCEPGQDPDRALDGVRRKWVPAIHMPRTASRITLEVIDVRVERLQDINEEDAVAEGMGMGCLVDPDTGDCGPDPVDRFRVLWESIHGPGSWEQNPFVWRISFRRIEQ